MKVYIAVLHDVHSDAIVVPYFNSSEATTHAKEWAKSHCRDQKSLKETFEHPNGYLYFAQYSGCGDRVWVTEHEVETEEEKRFRPGCNPPADPLQIALEGIRIRSNRHKNGDTDKWITTQKKHRG